MPGGRRRRAPPAHGRVGAAGVAAGGGAARRPASRTASSTARTGHPSCAARGQLLLERPVGVRAAPSRDPPTERRPRGGAGSRGQRHQAQRVRDAKRLLPTRVRPARGQTEVLDQLLERAAAFRAPSGPAGGGSRRGTLHRAELARERTSRGSRRALRAVRATAAPREQLVPPRQGGRDRWRRRSRGSKPSSQATPRRSGPAAWGRFG
jgi:hypothetical protein